MEKRSRCDSQVNCKYGSSDINEVPCSTCFRNNSKLTIKDNFEPGEPYCYKYNVIYISGKVGSGKDTVADYIKENYDFNAFSYATELKETLLSAGWDGKKDLRGRKLLQAVGKALREYDIDNWIKALILNNINFEADVWINKKPNIMLTDCRHTNEIERFVPLMSEYRPLSKCIKSITIRVVSKNSRGRAMDAETTKDISETSLDNYKFDYVIENSGSLFDLYSKIDECLNSAGFKKIAKNTNNELTDKKFIDKFLKKDE
jgi:dephospho-CoA kinase